MAAVRIEKLNRCFSRVAVSVVELWTVLLVLWVTIAGIYSSIFFLLFAPLIWAVILLHWLLLARVFQHRRWACLLACLYGWLFLYEPFVKGAFASWNVWGAALLSFLGGLRGSGGLVLLTVVTASVVVGWRELKNGW
jgi:hypothetical protein